MNELTMMRIYVVVFAAWTVVVLSALRVGVVPKTFRWMGYVWWITLIWPLALAILAWIKLFVEKIYDILN